MLFGRINKKLTPVPYRERTKTLYIFPGVAHNASKWSHSGAISLVMTLLPLNNLIQPIGLLIKHPGPLVFGVPI